MAIGIDLALQHDVDTDTYDLFLGPDGDLASTNSFETALLMSLFGEKRASISEMPIAQNRRGWLGNTFGDIEGFEMGSKLWLLDQARLTQDTLNLAITYAKDGMRWLVDFEHLERVRVTGEIIDNNIRLDITLLRSEAISETRSFFLWENTKGLN